MSKENIYLESKPRYETLDGLRGVAAILVILFHIFETYSKGQQDLNHGYLAVDFFFVLSGFVIGYAYDDRWDRMSTWGFFKRRLVRLHPLVIAGSVVGFCLFYFGTAAFPMILEAPLGRILLVLGMALLMLPCTPGMDIRGWQETNPLNGANWSLTLEYVGNILYALIFRHLPKWGLTILLALSALLTLNQCLGWDVFGMAADTGVSYNVKGGWSLAPEQVLIGFTRLLYPFICGLLISRILPSRMTKENPSGSPIRLKGGFWIASLILIVLFSWPCIGGDDCVWNGLYQAVAILVIFPLLVLMGAGSALSGGVSQKICKFLGDISYPLYITHYPLIYVHMDFARRYPEAPLYQHVLMSMGIVLLAIIMAYALLKMYDEPVRRYLTDHWLKRGRKQEA